MNQKELDSRNDVTEVVVNDAGVVTVSREVLRQSVEQVSRDIEKDVALTLKRYAESPAFLKRLKEARGVLEGPHSDIIAQTIRGDMSRYVASLGFGGATSLLDLPTIGSEGLAHKLRAAAGTLLDSSRGLTKHDRVDLPGMSSFKLNLAKWDYDAMCSTINLPIGNLGAIPTFQREKITSYLRLIMQRVTHMADLKEADTEDIVGGIVHALVHDWDAVGDFLVDYGVELDSQRMKSDAAAYATEILKSLQQIDKRAKERFITMTILQPLYRDVLRAQSEFRWPDWVDVANMAESYATWRRMKKDGVIRSMIQSDVTRVLTSDSLVSGLATLREATVLGVKQNICAALSSLASVSPCDSSFTFSSIDDAASIVMGLPFADMTRRVSLKNTLGDPVVIHDTLTSCPPAEHITRSEIMTAVRLLAKIQNVDIVSDISIDFLTRYPDWQGVVAHDISAIWDTRGGAFVLPLWVKDRLMTSFIAAVLNGEHGDNTVQALFTEHNAADLQKVFDAGLYYYSLSLSVLTKLLRAFLTCAANSYEWSSAPLWDELRRLSIFVVEPLDSKFKVEYHGEFTHGPVCVTSSGTASVALRYYHDEEAAAFAPAVGHYASLLRALNILGTLRTKAVHSRPFALPFVAPCDLQEVLACDSLPVVTKKELLGSVKQIDSQEINSLVLRTNRDVRATIYNASHTETGLLKGGFMMAVDVQPTIFVSFSELSRVAQLPVHLADTIPEGPELDSGDEFSCCGSMSMFRRVDPSFVLQVRRDEIPLASFDPQFVLPTDQHDLKLSVNAWANNILSQGSFTAESLDESSKQSSK